MIVALLLRIPSDEQLPPLTQAQTSTEGANNELAPLVSFAINTSGLFVACNKVHRNMNTPGNTSCKTELSGSPPSTSSVKLSPGSTTLIISTESFPTLTRKEDSADMLGGELPAWKKKKNRNYATALSIIMRYHTHLVGQ